MPNLGALILKKNTKFFKMLGLSFLQKKVICLILCFSFINFQISAQLISFENAYNNLFEIFEKKSNSSLKEAVFITENAFYDNKLYRVDFEQEIEYLNSLALIIEEKNNLLYKEKDSSNVRKLAALNFLMTDSIPLIVSGDSLYHTPFTYDFDDAFGKKNWESMFVSNLLKTKKGNCHSLPFLYKILADEIGAECHLALAPNHIYIKSKSEKVGWYNTELTNGSFPIDAWIMASGYVPLEAVQNGIYMRALSDKEAIAMCVVDLGMGYDRKFPNNDGSFTLKCCDLALKHFPNYITAILLKAETNQRLIRQLMEQHSVKTHQELFIKQKSAKPIWEAMEENYFLAHQLGYRQMPKKMYLDWLASLEKERSKYENRKVPDFKR